MFLKAPEAVVAVAAACSTFEDRSYAFLLLPPVETVLLLAPESGGSGGIKWS